MEIEETEELRHSELSRSEAGNEMARDARKRAFKEGLRDGLPIGLGYLAVAFSLGIVARNAGLNWLEGFVASFFTAASAGEYAGFRVIADGAPYWEMVVMTVVASARYLLMSAALAQKFDPKEPMRRRLLVGVYVTDELFGVNIARPGYVLPVYAYGAILAAIPAWALGTSLGIVAGNILPVAVVSALSVALYGMFIAIIIPPAKKNPVVAGLVLAGFVLSYLCVWLGERGIAFFAGMTEGVRTIILTVVLAALAAIFFPVKEDPYETGMNGEEVDLNA